MATIYKVTTKDPQPPGGDSRPTRWASSEGAARKEKKALCEKHGLKATGADYEQVEVPTSKAGIIEWLNDNFTHS
jgi:hypothetical protein